METLGNQNMPKICPKLCPKFCCNICDYNTSKKSSYDNHLVSSKHQKNVKGNVMETNGNQNMPKLCSSKYLCEICKKEFKNRSGLWKHNNKGNCLNKNDVNFNNANEENLEINSKESIEKSLNDKDLIMMLINDNKELRNLLLEQCKEKDEYKTMMMKVLENGTTNITHTNSHNKAFNLNFFLNETCKDAMNIMDFVESIKLQVSDLESVGELGYVEGISNIIVKNLNALDVTQRPVHCTDKKRETMYVKDADKWEKDEERQLMHKMIKKVADKNARLLPKFTEKYPDYKNYHSKNSDKYSKIIVESMGGSGDNDAEKADKIIRNIAKNVVVEK